VTLPEDASPEVTRNDVTGNERKIISRVFVRHPLTFHILIFSSQTAKPIDLQLGRKHLWKVLYKDYSFRPNSREKIKM
jgi:hypothetical protein